MKIVIVGGGASGLVSALAIKEKNPRNDVLVIDRNNKLGKKLRATGNGKCNMCNLFNIKGQYLNEERAKKLFNEINVEQLIKFFNNHNIATINHDGYIYPYSESANMLTDTLINEAKKLGVKFISECEALDYTNNKLITSKGTYPFDKLVIASGLISQPKLGADAKFVLNLSKHGYKVYPLYPALLPIKTVESTKEVNGLRREVRVRLVYKGKTYFDEEGELQFKKDGLSGIVIYHASSLYLRNHLSSAELLIDFLPNTKFNGKFENYFVSDLASYLKKKGNPKEVHFHIKGFYDANDSVATIGGVSLDNVDSSFNSKIEKNVYIIGEALNQDGLCGGYNLMWAFTSALKVSAII